MTDTIQSAAPESAGAGATSSGVNDSAQSAQGNAPEAINTDAKSIADIVQDKIDAKADGKAAAKASAKSDPASASKEAAPAVTPVVTPDGKIAYVPNYKYKVAGQEKELDEFWRPLLKDADSEARVKKTMSQVEAFDFMRERKEHFEKNFSNLTGDYDNLAGAVDRFDKSVAADDLSSAFRIAGIKKEAVYKWVAQQLQYDELPPEQRQQIEAAEASRMQKFDYEDKITRMEKQYQTQAVQTRTMQLDMALLKPEVANFAQSWDQSAEPGFTFRDTVAAEARRVYFETGQDLSPEQAVTMVMNRFGRFVSAGNAASPASQTPAVAAPRVATPPPVIPNVGGKAASPIKKVPKSIEDLKAIERSMP
jgi:hypothetical protein